MHRFASILQREFAFALVVESTPSCYILISFNTICTHRVRSCCRRYDIPLDAIEFTQPDSMCLTVPVEVH